MGELEGQLESLVFYEDRKDLTDEEWAKSERDRELATDNLSILEVMQRTSLNGDFFLLAFSFGLIRAINFSQSLLLGETMVAFGYNPAEISMLGIVFIVGGLSGALLIS